MGAPQEFFFSFLGGIYFLCLIGQMDCIPDQEHSGIIVLRE